MADKLLFDEAFLVKLERLTLLSRRTISGRTQGEKRSTKRGQSIEFTDYRAYFPGDDFRRIDWNAYARMERFFVRLYDEEEDLTVHFLIDSSHSMNWGQPEKFGYAVKVIGALGYVCLTSLDRVTVTELGRDTNNHFRSLPPIRGKRQAVSLFSFLQSLDTSNGDPITHMRDYAMTSNNSGIVVVLSDLMGDGWMDGINILASRGFEVIVINILSPDEREPELEGDLLLVDSEDDSTIEITADATTIDRYIKGLIHWQESWKRFCARRNLHYISIDTSLPLELLLFAWLRKEGMLK